MLFGTDSLSEGSLSIVADGLNRLGSSALLMWHDQGLRRYTATWYDVSPVASTKVNYGWTNGSYYFAAVDGDYIYYHANPAASGWTATGVNANSKDYKWIHNHNGFVYAGKDNKNQVYYSSDDTLSDLAGDPADDPNVIYIGPEGEKTVGMVSFMGNAYIFTEQRVYKLLHDQQTGTVVLDFTPEASRSTSVFSPGKWAVHNGQMILCIKDTVYQWNGVRLSDITPKRINDTFPFTTYGEFDNLTVAKTDLFCTAKSTVGSKYDLLAFDGIAWYTLATNVLDSITAMFYDPAQERLWICGLNGANRETRYIVLREKSRILATGFPTSGDNCLLTSKIDAGFRRVIKSTPSILVETSNLTANRYILVCYYLDGGALTPWGGNDGVTNKITSNGVTELTDPLGTGDSTIEYNNIQFRFAFVTDSSSQSPILQNFTVRLLMRPDTNFGYGFNIVATEHPEVGGRMIDDRRPAQIIADLHAARQSSAPVEFVDIYGVSHKVYISAINEQAVEYKGESPGATVNIEQRIFINLVEV